MAVTAESRLHFTAEAVLLYNRKHLQTIFNLLSISVTVLGFHRFVIETVLYLWEPPFIKDTCSMLKC